MSVVFSDGAFGNVKRIQQLNYNDRVIATDLRNPDFVKFGESFGVESVRAEGPEALRKAIERGFASGKPMLIDSPVPAFPDPWKHVALPRVRPPART